VGFAGCQDPFGPVNVLEIEETDGESVCIGVRERLVERHDGFGGGSVVYHPVHRSRNNRKTTKEWLTVVIEFWWLELQKDEEESWTKSRCLALRKRTEGHSHVISKVPAVSLWQCRYPVTASHVNRTW
jgi:hypothetical protein